MTCIGVEREKTICVSAVSLHTGGPLTVAREFLSALVEHADATNTRIIVFCYKRGLYSHLEGHRVQFIEMPYARRSWFLRLFVEYVYFWIWSNKRDVDVWISLHDTTPNVRARRRFAYCHNPAPFYDGASAWIREPTLEVFKRCYSWIYRANAKKNEAMIVQQSWFRNRLASITNLPPSRIFVARPVLVGRDPVAVRRDPARRACQLLYPAVPRVFKNFEVLFEAMCLVSVSDVELVLTFTGAENRYARWLLRRYGHVKNVRLVGYLDRERMVQQYVEADALIFPSLLETWGLPLSEFRAYGKPIFAADLPYAREVLSGYDQVCFFPPNSAEAIAGMIDGFATTAKGLSKAPEVPIAAPYSGTWGELISKLRL